MSGYLQRLVDSALPAAGPPPLAPVVRSTSPVFEQNQLLGLAGFQAGETDAAFMTPVFEDPAPQDAGAPAAAVVASALSPLGIPQRDPRPATPAPWSSLENGRAIAEEASTPRPAAADPITPPPQRPLEGALERAWPASEIADPAPRPDPMPLVEEAPAALPPTPVSRELAAAAVRIDRPTREAMPLVAAEATAQPDADPTLAVPQTLTRDAPRPFEGEAPRALEPVEPTPDTSPPPSSMLEPRARPDLRDVEPEADQPEPAPPQAPRITIGRVTVELVPDPAPVAKPAATSRTAAAASMIGPLGNRRMRRRLFVLSRL